MGNFKLIAIPCAGASAMMFFDWKNKLPKCVELVTVELPGRGLRFKDRHPDTMGELTDDLLSKIEPQIQECEYGFLGFCFGATVIYDMCRKLKAKGYRDPSILFIGSSAAPGVHIRSEKLFELSNFRIVLALLKIFSFNLFKASDEELMIVKSFISMTNPKLQEDIRNMSLWDMIIGFTFKNSLQGKKCQGVLNILKADGKLMYNYNITGNEISFSCPIIAIHGDLDELISLSDMKSWKCKTSGYFNLIEVHGGHMMVFDTPDVVIDIISRNIKEMIRDVVEEKVG